MHEFASPPDASSQTTPHAKHSISAHSNQNASLPDSLPTSAIKLQNNEKLSLAVQTEKSAISSAKSKEKAQVSEDFSSFHPISKIDGAKLWYFASRGEWGTLESSLKNVNSTDATYKNNVNLFSCL